jgi:hypothetical protein
MFPIIAIEELIDALCVPVADVPLINEVAVTLIFPNVFLTIGLIEPVPFEIMFTTYANDDDILAVSAFVADEPVV